MKYIHVLLKYEDFRGEKMKRAIYLLMVAIVAVLMVVVFISFVSNNHSISNNSPVHPPPFHFEDELYASYNVTGTGELTVNVSGNWSMAAVAVIYTPAYVNGGYVVIINPSGMEMDNMTLIHQSYVNYLVANESGWNVHLYGLAGHCKIKYHIEGNSIVTIQLRYKP